MSWLRMYILLFFVFGFPLAMANCDQQNSSVSPDKGLKMFGAVKTDESRSPEASKDSPSAAFVSGMLRFLTASSSSHLLYIVFDNTTEGTDDILSTSSGHHAQYTTVNMTSGPGVLGDVITQPITGTQTGRRHILLLCDFDNVVGVFRMIASGNLEDPATWWIVYASTEKMAEVLPTVLREGSQVIIIEKLSPDSVKLLASRIDSNGLISFEDVGTWHPGLRGYEGVQAPSGSIFQDPEVTYTNFNGRRMTVTANNNHPFIVMKRQDGRLVADGGFEKVILDSLSQTLNFTYQMVMPADGKWGGPIGNGTVVGMIGVVHRREAHFAICEITITGAREGVIDFTYPYYIESLTLVSRTPRERSKTLAAAAPFTSEVWLSIAISVLATGLVLKAQYWFSSHYSPDGVLRLKIGDSVFNMFRSLVMQDSLIILQFWTHKFTFLFWQLFCFIISVLYSGMLTAALVIPSFEKPINGLTDLPDAVKDGFTLVVTEDSSNEHIFKQATGGIYKDTWKLFNHVDRSKSFIKKADDSFGGILDDKLVLVNGQLSSRYLAMERGIRRYYFARDTFAPQYYGMACFQGSPFTDTFNRMLSYMIEGGLINKWIDREFQKVASTNVFLEETGPRAFSISQLQAAFYILFLGFVTAAMTFIAEMLSSVRKSS